MTIISAQHI